ncbi:MAG: saccharopine dehydrogenase, partial [Bacteroidota bacterium]
MKDKIMIYGAPGYTGCLFTKHLLANAMRPVLGARGNDVIKMGQALELESRRFTVEEAAAQLHD